jgi:DNA polymerase III epsilon subunit-like protein
MKEEILNRLLFIDTETTGLGEEDRIFQIAYEFRGEEKNELFLPPISISIEASETTGFTNKDVQDKESFAQSKMKKELEEILADPENIFVAHNAKFDVAMIEKEGLRVGRVIDTLKVAQALDPQGKLGAYRLQYLRYALDLDIKDARAHDALGDIRVLKALFLRLFSKLKKELGDDKIVIERMIEISSAPVLIKKFSFGKYVGEFVEVVAKNDPGYLEWLLKEKQKQAADGDLDED